MSIEITITQKGLIKRELPFEVICGNDLQFGTFDGLRLDEGVIGSKEFILYHPGHIGRGFSVVWCKGEKNQVDLRLLTPAPSEEIDDFYDTVERIVRVWKNSTITQDGTEISLEDIPRLRTESKQFNLRTLHDMCSEDTDWTMFCAFWPLTLTNDEKKRFSQADSLDEFRDCLHDKQSIDVYYAKPRFYSNGDGDGFIGIYTLTEDTRSVFPKTPFVPYGVTDSTGKPLEVDRWFVGISSITKNAYLGQIAYDNFITNIEGQSEYDAYNVLIENASLEAVESLIARFKTAI